MSERVITGRMVLGGFVGAFGLIIAVNVYMAYSAISTFPGLEVPNSYVASQVFDSQRRAQEDLGWRIESGYRDGVLTVGFRDRDGYPVRVDALSAVVARPTHRRDDRIPEFRYETGTFTAPLDLAPGAWNLMVEARAHDGTRFHQKIRLTVEG